MIVLSKVNKSRLTDIEKRQIKIKVINKTRCKCEQNIFFNQIRFICKNCKYYKKCLKDLRKFIDKELEML